MLRISETDAAVSAFILISPHLFQIFALAFALQMSAWFLFGDALLVNILILHKCFPLAALNPLCYLMNTFWWGLDPAHVACLAISAVFLPSLCQKGELEQQDRRMYHS